MAFDAKGSSNAEVSVGDRARARSSGGTGDGSGGGGGEIRACHEPRYDVDGGPLRFLQQHRASNRAMDTTPSGTRIDGRRTRSGAELGCAAVAIAEGTAASVGVPMEDGSWLVVEREVDSKITVVMDAA